MSRFEGAQLEQELDDILQDCLGVDCDLDDEEGRHSVEEWDSLAQVRIVHELESRFAMRLPASVLTDEALTVGSIKALVRRMA